MRTQVAQAAGRREDLSTAVTAPAGSSRNSPGDRPQEVLGGGLSDENTNTNTLRVPQVGGPTPPQLFSAPAPEAALGPQAAAPGVVVWLWKPGEEAAEEAPRSP